MNEIERRQGIELERQLMQLERRLLSTGFGEAANLVGAAAISVSEALAERRERENEREAEFADPELPPLTRLTGATEARHKRR